MKKIIAVIMALACIVCVFASCGKKDETPKELTSGDYTYVVLEDGTVKITKYNGTSDEIERDLPSEIDGKTVTVIGKEAFAGAEGLTVVNFPTGLVKIEERAFAESSKISWEIIMTVMPSSRLSLSINSYISAVTLGSSPDTGSSSKSIFRVAHRALASSTRCCWPPDSSR